MGYNNSGISLSQAFNQSTFQSPPRAFNVPFQISSSRFSIGVYTVRISGSAQTTLIGGNVVRGRIELRRDATNPPTTNRAQARNEVALTQSAGLNVGLTSTVTTDEVLTVFVPAGHWVELVTVDESGTPTYTLVIVQEMLLP